MHRIRRRTRLLATCVLVAPVIATPSFAQRTVAPVASAAPATGTTLIRNATVLTVTKGTLRNTDIRLQGSPSRRAIRNAAVERR